VPGFNFGLLSGMTRMHFVGDAEIFTKVPEHAEYLL
jgi:hypothetical protein